VKQIRRHLTYANVMSSLAVFMILGGGAAVAATKIGTKDLKAGAVKTGKLAKEAVASGKIKNGAVTEAKIGDNAVTTNKLIDNAVTGNKIADNAVTANKIANDAVTTGKVANGAVTGAKIANGTIGDEKLATQYLPASTQGVAAAGANVSSAGVIRTWFNRFGGKPTITKTGTGEYRLVFPGLEGQFYFSTSIVSAELITGAGELALGSANGNPIVNTYNSGGAAADHDFNLALILPGVEP